MQLRHFLASSPAAARRRINFLALSAAVVALGIAGGSRPAHAQDVEEGEDLLLSYNPANGTFAVGGKTPDANPFDRAMQKFGSTYISDTGFDVFPSIDAGYLDEDGNDIRNISQATLTQVGISPGLSAVYAFDSVTPVFGSTTNPANSQTGFKWVQAESKPPAQAQAVHSDTDDPYYLHQHFTFSASAPGTYFFDFQYTNIHTFTRDTDGNEVETGANGVSPTYRITYVTGAAAPEPGSVALILSVCAIGAWPLAAITHRRRRSNA